MKHKSARASDKESDAAIQVLKEDTCCPGPANVCSPARTAIDQAEPVLVGIFTLSMLQNGRLSDIEVRRKQSTPTGVPDAEIYRNALATRRVSMQRSAGASDPDDSSYQGEWERHGGRRSVREEWHMAHCAAISRAVRIEDAQMPAINHDRPHEVNGTQLSL